MKIALVNYRYFISGGPERYMFNIKEILESKGHEVIPFSVKHNKNVSSQFEPFFLDPIGNGDEIYSNEYRKNLKTLWQVSGRMLYSFEAKSKFLHFLKEIKPDIIYILHFQNKISCSIIDAAIEMKIPIVQRISDFGHICANAVFFRKEKGICEDCVSINLFQAVKHKCISGSYINSALKALSLAIMKHKRVSEKISAFVFPSAFTMQKYASSGFNLNKLFHIPTFFNPTLLKSSPSIQYENYALFIGRIEEEKGMQTLLSAFTNTKFNLKIIGFSNNDFVNILKKQLNGVHHNIEFMGKMDFNEIANYLKNCLFTIVPSEWYENQPNTILESFAFKKAVVATKIGSLPEIVIDNITGLTFEYQSSDSLKEKIHYMFKNKSEAQKLGNNAYQFIQDKYSSETHYSQLIQLFQTILKNVEKY